MVEYRAWRLICPLLRSRRMSARTSDCSFRSLPMNRNTIYITNRIIHSYFRVQSKFILTYKIPRTWPSLHSMSQPTVVGLDNVVRPSTESKHAKTAWLDGLQPISTIISVELAEPCHQSRRQTAVKNLVLREDKLGRQVSQCQHLFEE